MCVGMWSGWGGGGILWFVVWKLEGVNHFEPLGIDGRVILIGYARNSLDLDWDDLSLGVGLGRLNCFPPDSKLFHLQGQFRYLLNFSGIRLEFSDNFR